MRNNYNNKKDSLKKKNSKKLIGRKKSCRFCKNSDEIIDYKRVKMLALFLSERCKIAPRRVTGNCQFHQTRVVEAIKRARHLAMLPYTITHVIRY